MVAIATTHMISKNKDIYVSEPELVSGTIMANRSDTGEGKRDGLKVRAKCVMSTTDGPRARLGSPSRLDRIHHRSSHGILRLDYETL